jgi:hypothetical protein
VGRVRAGPARKQHGAQAGFHLPHAIRVSSRWPPPSIHPGRPAAQLPAVGSFPFTRRAQQPAGSTAARPFFLPTRHLLPLLNCCAGGWRPMELESQPRRQESMRMRCGSADQRVDRPESTSWSAAAASAGLASFLPSASPPRCMSICLQPTAECRLHRSCKNETKKTTCSKSMVACHLSNSQKY